MVVYYRPDMWVEKRDDYVRKAGLFKSIVVESIG